MQDRVGALAGRRVLVTGGTGFIGSHLVRRLVGLGADVGVLVRDRGRSQVTGVPAGVRTHVADLTDRAALDRAVGEARPEVVFHLAAFTEVGRSWDDPASCVRVNVEGTVSLLEALESRGCDRVVHASTSDVYGNCAVPVRETATPSPASPYAASKLAAEMFCRLAFERTGAPIVQLRVFNAYGPGQAPDRVIPEIITKALDRTALEMTRGTQTREFNFVLDLVDGFLLAAVADDVAGEVINLGCGEETSVADVAGLILELMDDPITPQLGARPERPGEIARMFCDATKARELLGWAPARSLREGLVETIDWYTQHPEDRSRSGGAE